MKIAVIGASGFIGKALVKEAVKRKETVYAVSRNKQFDDSDKLISVLHDINDWEGLAEKIADADVIISAFNSNRKSPSYRDDYMKGSSAVIALAKRLDKHVVIVGGASSLYLPKTNQQLFYDMPEEFRARVKGPFDLYHLIKHDFSFKWTFVSPALELNEDEPSYDYHIGGDYILYNREGKNTVSIYDLADLMINSAHQEHLYHKRITLSYK